MRQEDAKRRLESVHGYKLNEASLEESKAHATIQIKVIELFQKSGYEVRTPRVIRGISGMEHAFDISTRKGNSEIVPDMVSGATDVGPETIVDFSAKILDAKPARSILIAMPRLNAEAGKLSRMYNIEMVVESEVREVLEKLTNLLGIKTLPE